MWGEGKLVIDYVIGNQEAIEEITDMKVGKRVESVAIGNRNRGTRVTKR